MNLPQGDTGRVICRQLTVHGSLEAAIHATVSEPGPEWTSMGAGGRDSASTARLWYSPAAMPVTSLRPLTGTGVAEPVVVPLPSCPISLAPHANTVPPPSARL